MQRHLTWRPVESFRDMQASTSSHEVRDTVALDDLLPLPCLAKSLTWWREQKYTLVRTHGCCYWHRELLCLSYIFASHSVPFRDLLIREIWFCMYFLRGSHQIRGKSLRLELVWLGRTFPCRSFSGISGILGILQRRKMWHWEHSVSQSSVICSVCVLKPPGIIAAAFF